MLNLKVIVPSELGTAESIFSLPPFVLNPATTIEFMFTPTFKVVCSVFCEVVVKAPDKSPIAALTDEAELAPVPPFAIGKTPETFVVRFTASSAMVTAPVLASVTSPLTATEAISVPSPTKI